MKKKYIVPKMEAVEIGATLLQTTSPPPIPMNGGDGNQITNENLICYAEKQNQITFSSLL